jgi:hypothetical protein
VSAGTGGTEVCRTKMGRFHFRYTSATTKFAESAVFLVILSNVLSFSLSLFSLQGLWMYNENKDNGEKFSVQEAKQWNDEKKVLASTAEGKKS